MKRFALIAIITLTAPAAQAQYYPYQAPQQGYTPAPLPYSQVKPWLPPAYPPGTTPGTMIWPPGQTVIQPPAPQSYFPRYQP